MWATDYALPRPDRYRHRAGAAQCRPCLPVARKDTVSFSSESHPTRLLCFDGPGRIGSVLLSRLPRYLTLQESGAERVRVRRVVVVARVPVRVHVHEVRRVGSVRRPLPPVARHKPDCRQRPLINPGSRTVSDPMPGSYKQDHSSRTAAWPTWPCWLPRPFLSQTRPKEACSLL